MNKTLELKDKNEKVLYPIWIDTKRRLNNMTNLISKGTTTCEGCGMELIARSILEVLGENTIILTPPSCSAILTGFGDQTCWKIPSFQSNLENIAAYCSGISTALEYQNRKDTYVVALAGDGGNCRYRVTGLVRGY